VPARRNFLKSNPVEMRHIIDEFVHIALSYHNVSISLHHNDLELYHLQSTTQHLRAIALLGSNYKQMLVEVDEHTSIVEVKGYIGKPEVAKKTRGDQYFFVNQRYIKSPLLHHAVASAFESLMTKDKFASYVLFLTVEPDKIDINVHPTKHEIKFEDERHIYTILNAAIRKALGQLTPSQFQMPAQSMVESSRFATLIDSKSSYSYTPSNGGNSNNGITRMQQKQWEELVNDTITHKNNQRVESVQITIPQTFSSVIDNDDHDNKYSQPYQLHQQYIFSPIRNAFIIINQEAAHQRILFERFIEKLNQRNGVVQQLLFARTVEFSPSDAVLLHEIMDDIKAMGFELQALGPNTFLMKGIPNDLQYDDEQRLIENILEQYKNNKQKLRMPHSENIAKTLALHAGIKRGKTLTEREMKQLIDELFACQQPEHSPFGDKTYIRVGLDELATMLH
jgi:DNA mismatch repair protein MutL